MISLDMGPPPPQGDRGFSRIAVSSFRKALPSLKLILCSWPGLKSPAKLMFRLIMYDIKAYSIQWTIDICTNFCCHIHYQHCSVTVLNQTVISTPDSFKVNKLSPLLLVILPVDMNALNFYYWRHWFGSKKRPIGKSTINSLSLPYWLAVSRMPILWYFTTLSAGLTPVTSFWARRDDQKPHVDLSEGCF